MGDTLSISLAETNKIRASFGLKLIPEENTKGSNVQLPVKGNDKQNNSRIVAAQSDGQYSSSRRFSNNGLDDSRTFELKKRIARMKLKSTLSQDVEDVRGDEDWLSTIGIGNPTPSKVVSKNEKNQVVSTETIQSTRKASIKVSGDLTAKITSKPMILTLQESTVGTVDGEQDVLHNETISHEKEDAENIKLKQLNKERKLKKISLPPIVQDYGEEDGIHGVPMSVNLGGTTKFPLEGDHDIGENDTLHGKRRIKLESGSENDEPEPDFAPMKIKKRKKKDLRSKPKVIDKSKMVKVDILDEDMEEASEPVFKVEKKPKYTQDPGQAAMNMEAIEESTRKSHSIHMSSISKNMLLLGENDEFLDSIKTNILETTTNGTPIKLDLKQQNSTLPSQKLANDINSESHPTSVDFSNGIAGALNFLKEKNIIKPSQRTSVETIRRTKIQAEQEQRAAEIRSKLSQNLKAKQGLAFTDNELQDFKATENEKIAAEIGDLQREKLKNYNPEIELTYKDSNGNELTTKEAYKQISQAWHGTKSNKKKIAKQQKKFEERKRQVERDSFLGV